MVKETRVMVCVTLQKTCEKLIELGQGIAVKENAKLFIVHVAREKEDILGNPKTGEALEFLYNLSKKSGAEMTILRTEDIVYELISFARDNNITIAVLGKSAEVENPNGISHSFEYYLPDVKIIKVP